MTAEKPQPQKKANDPATLRCDNEPCLFHHLGICRFSCHQWHPCSSPAPEPITADEIGDMMDDVAKAAAQQERERVLEEMFEFIDFNHSCPLDYVTCQRIKKYGESLRGGEQR